MFGKMFGEHPRHSVISPPGLKPTIILIIFPS